MRHTFLNNQRKALLRRAGAFAGAATALGFAVRRRSAGVWTGATLVALPLAARGVTGRWPMAGSLKNAVPVELATRLVIQLPPEAVFDGWRRLEQLPQVLRHVAKVEELPDGRSHWCAHTPGGEVEWQTEIVEERRPVLLQWRSLPDSDVAHEGRLKLSSCHNGQATLLDLQMRITACRGSRGRARAAVAALLRPALALEIRADLRRFRSLLEAGEIPTTEGQPAGERSPLEMRNPI